MYWEVNSDAGNYSLNLFFEVPSYARRMIWENGCDYKSGTPSADCASIPVDYLSAYKKGSHHNSVNMSYDKQTGSELFQLLSNTESGGIFNEFKWQAEDNDLTDNLTWVTSREYLIKSGLCTTESCLQFDSTASIELMLSGLDSESEALALMNSITAMRLHLSDEARELPATTVVPVPAAVWLFGSSLLGLAGLARRKA